MALAATVNAGSNATTFALPAEVFPSEIRTAGHGFAAAAGKLGAAIGGLLFPVVRHRAARAAARHVHPGSAHDEQAVVL
ncbi:hypothetical protein [Pseudonocardia alaniniphila]|uniref:hypothetical protein n=1 Tax=Pseudonocardia alaniniphila TaxID=75291 RepID=UPI003382B48B